MSDDLRDLVERLVSETRLPVSAIRTALGVLEAGVGEWPGDPLPEEAIVKALPMVVYSAHATGMSAAVLAVAHRQSAGIGQDRKAA